MKKRLTVVAAVVALVAIVGGVGWTLSAAGDSGKEGGRELVADSSQSGKQIEAKQGDVIKLMLESNVTTGFQWQLERNTNEASLSLIGHRYVDPAGDGGEPALGGGGTEEWSFKAAAKGTSELTLRYGQPWPGGITRDRTFELTVVVD